jgi:FG-GAP-like repeat/FG-GAP repeat
VPDGNIARLSILLGNGDGTFQTPVAYPADYYSNGIAVADFNGDGNLDVAVTSYQQHTVSIYFGNGDGTFQAPVDYNVFYPPRALAIGDFDLDGSRDLAVGDNQGDVFILLNNGDGTFRLAANASLGGPVTAIAVGDFNGDGIPDLAGADAFNGPGLTIAMGNGDGTFQDPVGYVTDGRLPTSVAVGDFNGDGTMDIVTANGGPGSVSVFLNNGDGTFQPAVNYAAGYLPSSVACADLNGDGNVDLVVANPYGNRDIKVLLGNGDGTFQAPLSYPVGDHPFAVAAGDFNGDNYPDLALAGQDGTVDVLLNQADWNTTPRTGSAAKRLAAAEVDLVLPPTSTAELTALQSTLTGAANHTQDIKTPGATYLPASPTTRGPMLPSFVGQAAFRLLPRAPTVDVVLDSLDLATALE